MHADSPKNDRQSLDVANTLRLTPGELLLETQPVMLRVTVDTCGTVMDPAVGTRSHDVQPLHQPISLSTLSSPSHTPQHPTPAFAELPALSCGAYPVFLAIQFDFNLHRSCAPFRRYHAR